LNAPAIALLDRALEELSREDLTLAVRLARQTLADHLDGCRREINELTDRNRSLCRELDDARATVVLLRELHE